MWMGGGLSKTRPKKGRRGFKVEGNGQQQKEMEEDKISSQPYSNVI